MRIETVKNMAPLSRVATASANVSDLVSAILKDVKENGDAAVLSYTRRFDSELVEGLEVTEAEVAEAMGSLPESFIEILKEAAENIRRYHEKQGKTAYRIEENGKILGRIVRPLNRVGIYVPGGTAAYPSTVLMNCIPAKLAGVKELCLVSPPDKDGKMRPATVAAAKIAGVDRLFKMGGAQAVAALAYGTETVPNVDKITGPGNAFVAEAKRQVFGLVDIDMIAGPSEILIVADETARPDYLAADLLSQAEHDKNAASILITTSKELAEKTLTEVEKQLSKLPRRDIAEASIRDNGRIILCNTLEEAMDLSNEFAPEHLELCVADPEALLAMVTNAGSVFMGSYAPEALGDYFSGTNHVLPTGGSARFSSPLSVEDYQKTFSYTWYERDAFLPVQKKIGEFAEFEGLTAHANSALIRE